MIVGPFGSGKGRLVERLETSLATSFEVCPTEAQAGTPLRRRLRALGAQSVDTPDDAVRYLLDSQGVARGAEGLPTRTLVFRDVDLFDEESLETLEMTIATQQVAVVMTCSSESRVSRRFGRLLRGHRGLRVALTALSDEEVRQTIAATLNAEPTAALYEYLRGVTNCFAQDLRSVARTGRAEGWIAHTSGRSAVLRSPMWLDRTAAVAFCRKLEGVLSESTVDLLRQIALAEALPTLNLFADPATRDTVDWCEEAGLVRIEGEFVVMARHCHRHLLILAPGQEYLAEAETAADILHEQCSSIPPGRDAAIWAAKEHLERGMLDQARFLLSTVPRSDPRACGVEAGILAVSGAPRSALRTLLAGTAGAEVPVDVAALETFLRSALLYRPSDGGASSMDEVAQRLEELEDFVPQGYLEKFPAPTGTLAAYRPHSGHRLGYREPAADAELLARSTRAALDAYAAVLAGNFRRTASSLAVVTSISAAELPIVALAWIIERVGLTRILAFPSEEVLPEHWTAGETPDRRLLHAMTEGALGVLKGIFCGVDAGTLREDLDDLWLQFEVGLPLGNLTRRLFEALDFVVSGRRSEEIFGPTSHVPTSLDTTFRDVCVDVVVLMGRLLHAPAQELLPTLAESAAQQPLAPGMQRTALRCLLLRRTSELPAAVLHPLVTLAAEAGVEPEIVATVHAYLKSPSSSARDLLCRGVPGHPAFRFCLVGADGEAGARILDHTFTDQLSVREADVATRLINGVSAQDVAAQLDISVRTVQVHIRSIYRKLGVGSRLQLLALSHSGGEPK